MSSMLSSASETPSLSFADEMPSRLAVPWIALAMTAGVLADRFGGVPTTFALAVAAASLIAWLIARSTRQGIAFLLLSAAALGAAYHHVRLADVKGGVLANLASPEGTPIRVRGRLSEPIQIVRGGDDPLVTIPKLDATRMVIDVDQIDGSAGTRPVHGRIVAYVPGVRDGIRVGDSVDARGRLIAPREAANPGEIDTLNSLRDRGIEAILSVPDIDGAFGQVGHGWPTSPLGWLGRLHDGCRDILRERLGEERAPLAIALLLGDTSGMDRDHWDKFLRSGVVHALAISGQHLIVLAAILMFVRRLFRIRFVPATVAIAAFLLAYALLTGGRAPAMRAAWTMIAFSLAAVLRRPGSTFNAFAIAWLGVLITNPAELSQIGCQLSFLAIATLKWSVEVWLRPVEDDPLAALDRIQDSPLRRRLRESCKFLGDTYLTNALVWIAVSPLLASKFHIVSPIALVIGPPVVALTSVALIAGFVLLATATIAPPVACLFAKIVELSFICCEGLIDLGLQVPGAWLTVPGLPAVYLGVFYGCIVASFIVSVWQIRLFSAAAVAWAATLAIVLWAPRSGNEFRVAFLSVGHGVCTVVETSGGRVLVYDAGAMGGPEISRRIIMPYLWSRGYRRIDELFISHADLDHYNGVPDLAEHFAIGRVWMTPSFSARDLPAIRRVTEAFAARGVETRVIKAGDQVTIDDVALHALHPPARGPEGKENARSLTMLVRKGSFSVLLTGDLEEPGLSQVLTLAPIGVDVLLAPHHGSPTANTPALAKWAMPRLAISSQGRPRGLASAAAVYEAVHARYLTTDHEGAVTVRLKDADIWVETFRTKQNLRLGPVIVR